MKYVSKIELLGILVDMTIFICLPLTAAPILINWWLTIIIPTTGLEAIAFALPVTASICAYFIIIFSIIAEKTIILGPYIDKINKKEWDEIKNLPFPYKKHREC